MVERRHALLDDEDRLQQRIEELGPWSSSSASPSSSCSACSPRECLRRLSELYGAKPRLLSSKSDP